MATQTVRTIYEAVVNQAQANLGRLARETDKTATSVDKLDQALDSAGKRDVTPEVDVDIREAEAEVRKLTAELDKLEKTHIDPNIEVDIAKSEAKIDKLETELQILGRMDPSPQVTADTERAEAQIEGLRARITAMESLTAESTLTVDVDRARTDLADAEAKLKELQGAKAEMVLEVDSDSVEQAFDDAEDAAEEGGESAGMAGAGGIAAALKSGSAKNLVAGGVLGLIAGVGVQLNKAAVDWVRSGLEPNRLEDVFGASAGLDEGTARRFGAAAGDAYANAWGDSVEANLATGKSALDNALLPSTATQAEIRGTIEQLTAVSEILDVDVTEAAEAAGNMMKSGLAENAEEAFDIIVAGSQNGLDRSKDWIDTLREYSQMFESLGLSGAEAGGLIEQAMDAGARNSDVAADALKEFSIRAQDDSKAVRQAYQDLGLDADEMGSKIAAGGEDAKEGLDLVLDGLRDIEDPMERNAAGVALFGTMWEDMGNGAGVLAMDLDGLGDSWVNVGDTAQDAMDRMSDNAATSLETTKRTVENTLTQLAGGLASAWEEPIQGISEWVLANRSVILEYLYDFQDGFFDAARAVVEFGAMVVDVSGNAAGALAPLVSGLGLAVEAAGHLSGNQDLIDFGDNIQTAADGMSEFADGAEGMAETMRTDWIGAIDDAEDRMGEWRGPALLRAQLDDAIYVMTTRVDEFSDHVDEAGGTVTINGDELPAEEALNALIEAVSESDGTVQINGETYSAEEALDAYMRVIEENPGEVTVTANTGPAEEQFEGLVSSTPPATIDTGADTGDAESSINHAARDRDTSIDVGDNASGSSSRIDSASRDRGSHIDVDDNSSAANSRINNAARNRRMTITVGYSDPGFRGSGGSSRGFAYGGRVPGSSGFASGYGIVPAPAAPYGVDNILWPDMSGGGPGLATGGPVLGRPLAGGEWVVNPISSRQHDATLRAINAGASRAEIAALVGAGASAPVDTGAIASAVNAAMSSWQPMVQIGRKTLYGEMVSAGREEARR